MIDRLLAQTSFEGNFEDLKEVGTARLFPVPRVQFEGLTFATPSGRIEVRSDRLVEQGLPPVPVAHADEVPEEGRLRLLTPAGEWLMNSSYGNDPKIAAQLGPARVHLNAKDAARRNLAQGEVVRLSTKAGAIELTVNISADVPEGVALAHKSRWPSLTKGESNINILNPGLRTDIADSTAVHGLEVDLVKLGD